MAWKGNMNWQQMIQEKRIYGLEKHDEECSDPFGGYYDKRLGREVPNAHMLAKDYGMWILEAIPTMAIFFKTILGA